MKAMPNPKPLYRSPELVKDTGTVLVVEGEKDVETAESIGILATTWPGGANAVGKCEVDLLAGRDVVVIPDQDDKGRQAMRALVDRLGELKPQPKVRWLELSSKVNGSPMPDKGDLTEWVDTHGDAATPEVINENLQALIDSTETVELPKPDSPLTWRPFPTEVLPEALRHFVERGASAIGCDPSYVLLPTLVVCAALIGASRMIELKRSWREPAVFWAAIVGESGTQKTPAFKVATRWLTTLQAKAHRDHAMAMVEYENNQKHYEKELAQWKKSKVSFGEPVPPEKPAAIRFLVSDTTVEALVRVLQNNPRGVLSAVDELAGWFGSFDKYRGGKASGDSAAWLSMFNAGFVQCDRATSGSLYVPQAAVSIVGGIQPGILRRVLGDEHRESGLAARILLVCPPRRAKRWTESDMPLSIEERMDDVYDGLRHLQPLSQDETELHPVVATLSPEAKQQFIRFVNVHGSEAAELQGDLSAASSKLEAYCARFALVLHYIRVVDGDLPVDAEDDLIDADTMRAAIAVTEWFKHETRRAYGIFSESAGAKRDRELAEWIGSKGGDLSLREIQQGRRELKTAGDTEAAVNRLVTAGIGERYVGSPPSSGGHAQDKFRLSTPSTSTLAHRTRDLAASVDAETPNRRESAFDAWSDGSDMGAA